jgi:hypothetical protein
MDHITLISVNRSIPTLLSKKVKEKEKEKEHTNLKY